MAAGGASSQNKSESMSFFGVADSEHQVVVETSGENEHGASSVSVYRNAATSSSQPTSALTYDAAVRAVAVATLSGAPCLLLALASERSVRLTLLDAARPVASIRLADHVTALAALPAALAPLLRRRFAASATSSSSSSSPPSSLDDAAFVVAGTRGGHLLLLALHLAGPAVRHIVDAGTAASSSSSSSPSSPAPASHDAAAVPCVDLGVAAELAAALPAEWRGAGRAVTCVQVWPAVRCVAVGYACGALLVVSLLDGAVVLCERLGGAALHLPVTAAAFQALADDSSAFVWAASGAVLTLFQLKFDSSGELERGPLDAAASADDADDDEYVRDYLVRPRSVTLSHQRTLAARGSVLCLSTLQARRDRSLRYALVVWRDDDDGAARAELFDLFALVHGSTHDDARLFAPLTLPPTDGSGEQLTAAFVRPESILPPISLRARISAEALRRGDIVLDDHRALAPLTFTLTLLYETAAVAVHVVDAQRAALSALRAAGASALVAPASTYAQLCDVGLIDGGAIDGESDAAAAPSRRRALLTAALECGEAAFVCGAVLELRAALALDVEAVLGSRYVIGNPALVLDWALHVVAVLERRIALALGSVEHSAADVSDAGSLALVNANAGKRRFWCTRAFSWLGDVHDVLGALLRRDELGTSESGVARIEALREHVRCVAQQLEFGSWLVDVGLHARDADDDAAAQSLGQRQQRALLELERVVAQRRVQRAAAHSAHGVVVDAARMTASSDVRSDVPLLIDTWCAQLGVAYPFASVASLLALFGAAGGDSSTVATKQRAALYFLIDAEQCGPLLATSSAAADAEPVASLYARHFGISVEEMRLVHGAWLLDSGAWHAALGYFCQSAPADAAFGARVRAATADVAPPVAALLLERASAATLSRDDADENDVRGRVLLACALIDEALDAARAAPAEQRAPLLWRVFQQCAALDAKALLHAPLAPAEEELYARFAHAAVGRPILLPRDGYVANDEAEYEASCRPLELLLAYSLARGRVLDGFAANEALRSAAERAPQIAGSASAERRAMRAELRNALLDNYVLALPRAQREHVEQAAQAAQQRMQTDVWALPAQPPSVARAAARRARPSSPPAATTTSEAVLNRFMAPPSTAAAVRTRSVTAALADAAADTATRRAIDFSAAAQAEELLARAPSPPRSLPQRAAAAAAAATASIPSPSTRVVPGSPAAKKSAARTSAASTPLPVKARAMSSLRAVATPVAEAPPAMVLPTELQSSSHVDEMEAYFAQFSRR
jgi:hypothetical protein